MDSLNSPRWNNEHARRSCSSTRSGSSPAAVCSRCLQKGLRLVELTSILVETGQPVRHPVCRPGVVHCDVKLSCTLEASLRLRRIPSLDGKGHSDGTGEQVSLWALTLITVGHERQHV